ncbi:MAG: CDP-glucose 4,6-dehydratase [Acetobacteraceae bacterium]
MPAPLPDPGFWTGRRVLLTGHTGFKGAWTALWLHRMGARVSGIALPPEELSLYNLLRLDRIIESGFVDLRDGPEIARAVRRAEPDIVLHMAAQPLVRRSLAAPAESFAVNVLGTVHVLDALREMPGLSTVLVVTTDKVYANDESGHAYAETDRLGGKDPYSASKAACEIATAAMAHSFLAPSGIAVATARAGNVIGGGDFAVDRLVPDIVRAARAGRQPVLRNPDATRPWQHVLDCVCGYLLYVAGLAAGRTLPLTLNFGPGNTLRATVGELADAMLQALDQPSSWAHFSERRMPEARALAINSHLARRTLGWTDRLRGSALIGTTAAWYRAWTRGEDMLEVSLGQIAEYEALS